MSDTKAENKQKLFKLQQDRVQLCSDIGHSTCFIQVHQQNIDESVIKVHNLSLKIKALETTIAKEAELERLEGKKDVQTEN